MLNKKSDGITAMVAGRVLGRVLLPLAGIIHDASDASADTQLQRAVSPFRLSTYCWSMPQGFTPPSARLASRLAAFTTNRHESCGLADLEIHGGALIVAQDIELHGALVAKLLKEREHRARITNLHAIDLLEDVPVF